MNIGDGLVTDDDSTSVGRLYTLWHAVKLLVAMPLFVLLALPSLAKAAPSEAKPAWVGVWQGTVGNAAVMVCLQHDDYQDFGAYYYLRHLSIITLGKREGQLVWTESPNSDQAVKGPLWRLTAFSGSHLQGIWSQGAKTLPIGLTRIPLVKPKAGDADDSSCGNEAFSMPRFVKPVITTKAATLNSVAYTRVLADPGKQFEGSDTEVFQLNGSTPAIKRVNAELYKNIPTSPDNATYFMCSMVALGQNGLDGDASSSIKPLILTKSWMVLENDESDDCGGAHPNSNTIYETWNLRTGSKVNLYDWFSRAALTQTINEPGSSNQYITVVFTAPFKKMIDEAYSREDAECKDALVGADTWRPRPTETGIAFTPELPHAAQACEEDAEVPYKKLTPYLSAEGKLETAAFLAELSRSR